MHIQLFRIQYKRLIRRTGFILLFIFAYFNTILALSKGGSEIEPPDTVKKEGPRYPLEPKYNYPYSTSGYVSPLLMPPPSNVEQKVVYDPKTNSYILSEKIGDIDYRPPVTMSFDEYNKYQTGTAQRDYWRQKSLEDMGAGPSFMKNLRLGNPTIDKFFGGEGITITPQGSAEIIFGYTISNNQNPQIPVRSRKNGSFLFNMKIMMNVTGSIGDKMEVALNYNTEANFDFENKTKLEYTGKEDEIVKKIEAGDVSFSVPGTLITGSQSLFGIRTDLQFGKLTVSSVMSHQRSESSSINVQGGAQETEFEVNIDEYDANRHFFLSHFFRDNYDEWLKNLPHIESQVKIEQIEVWVVNRQNDFTQIRDIVALMDIGEGYGPDGQENFQAPFNVISPDSKLNEPTSNDLNNLYSQLNRNDFIRHLNTVDAAFAGISSQLERGRDYVSLESARPLSEREFTVNRELGFISLNSPLRNDEILAVAYTYSYQGKIYKVGEISQDKKAPDILIVKLLKGITQTPKYKNWDLMMKNIYSIGAYQVSPEKFVLDVLYRNDKTGVATNYLTEKEGFLPDAVYQVPLLKILELDNLDARNEPYPDGMFDFAEGITIYARNGRIIFPVVEPFGSYLKKKIVDDGNNDQWKKTAERYIYEELYDSTQTKAQQIAEKNKFVLRGHYRSSASSDIMLNAMNVPRGSVVVTAGGRALIENQDYTVDYTLGRVKIIDQGLIESGTPIQVKLENNSMFRMQTKSLIGTHLDYKFSENFNVGATAIRLSERPLTEKVNLGDEPISNTIIGLNTSYRTESQFLTTLVDKIPLIETKEKSSIAFDAEIAQLIPRQSGSISKKGIAYIDDFEAAQTKNSLLSEHSWNLCSPPDDGNLRTFANSWQEGVPSGYGRAKLAWYTIDGLFYGDGVEKPDNIDIEKNEVRMIKQQELFPNKDEDIAGFESRVSVFNLNFYPSERGPYNFDPGSIGSGQLSIPEDRWAGIMRSISNSDFETANIEYIEFWLMDPYADYDVPGSGGDLYIHLGEISEDILKDNRKSFENGLPTTDEIEGVEETVWGLIPTGRSVVDGFAGGAETRKFQDIGLDGLSNEKEKLKFTGFENFDDPAADDFRYFLGDELDAQEADIKERYKNFNGLENNSPSLTESDVYSPSSRQTPDKEDINEDNTLNTSETYYQYHISLRPEDFKIGSNFIIDQITLAAKGERNAATWYLFRVPIDEFESKIGNMEDFKAIRFMRLMLAGFDSPVTLRFASLDLVRGEWRRYNDDIYESTPLVSNQQSGTSFEVSSVNIEENGSKQPVNYVLPPGITRVTDPSQPQISLENEQSLLVKVTDLADNDGRAVYKNTQLDLRQYKYLKMYIHAEALPEQENELDDFEVSAFIRIGSDYQNNYYEYEIPLAVTTPGESNADLIWQVDTNTLTLDLQKLVALKLERNKAMETDPFVVSQSLFVRPDGKNKIKVKGNPNLSNIRQIMLGVRNPGKDESILVGNNQIMVDNDGEPKSAEIWFNELRLSDFNNKGGWAATGQFQAKLADLGIINIAGNSSQPGFGSIEQTVEERQKEEINQIDLSTNLELGKFFPEKAKVTIPMYMGYSNTTINPQYYPKDPDVTLEQALKLAKSDEERKQIKDLSQDVTERKSINFTNVRWNKQFKKFRVFSPSNLSATAVYSETYAHNYSVEYNILRKYGASLNYVYNKNVKPVKPFDKTKIFKKPAFRIIKDINFNYQPSAFTFGTKLDRDYQTMKLRDVYDDAEMIIEPTTSKGFYWDRDYSLRWDLTQNLKFDYTASNRAIIDEPKDESDLFTPNNQEWKNEVWTNMNTGGRNLQFNQKFSTSYKLPLNKIQLLNWTDLKVSYDATYSWTRGPILLDSAPELGHTLKNSNTIKLSGNFNMKNLYNKIGYFKTIDTKYSNKKQKKAADNKDARFKTVEYTKKTFLKKGDPKSVIHRLGTENVTVKVTSDDGREIPVKMTIDGENKITLESEEDIAGATVLVQGKIEKGENPFVFVADNTVRLILGIKNISLNYSRTAGTMLPGYLPQTTLFGFDMGDFYGAPDWPFVAGWQDEDILYKARDKGWLTQNQTFSEPTIFDIKETFDGRINFEPFKGLRIDITGMLSHSYSTEQNYLPFLGEEDQIGNKYRGGSYSLSVITLSSTFEEMNEGNKWQSAVYNKFKESRAVIASRLNAKKNEESPLYFASLDHISQDGYADGYSENSSEVLMYAFLSAYTGNEPGRISLDMFPYTLMPNWKVTFDGLSEIDFIKKFAKNISLTHAYKSQYNINSYSTNVSYFLEEDYINRSLAGADADLRGLMRDLQDNFLTLYQPNSVSIKEDLSPLVGIDISWQNDLLTKFEIRKGRMLSLSMNNSQLSETHNDDIIIGAGYKFKNVVLPITTRTGENKNIKSDLNLKLDLTIRKNITLLRSLVEDTEDVPTTGARKFTLGITADYVLSPRLNIQMFFDRSVNTPYVSNYYPNSETSFGFSLRLSL